MNHNEAKHIEAMQADGERAEELRTLLAACHDVVSDYDMASQEKYDECCWQEFGGVEAIREALLPFSTLPPSSSAE